MESRIKRKPAEKRKVERQLHARLILDELYERMTFQRGMESSSKGKVIKYTLDQWPKLARSADEGHLSIDNNRAERAIKPLVIDGGAGYSRTRYVTVL
ncbi:hypothetical protein VCHA43P277_40115 [Vibrio chagasii]|nr:hypothetical protein VCHA35O141_30065 [Vibrio chagasii]CAH6954779.1 hypothetical protein VCHA35O143_30176 [Vibrio chagasii]CAH6989163.1 hypothetical protein VCHA31O73_40067 [Vibrio chagasii]CAH7003110.1 hypothetical protein VCHA34P126_50116 [Vibrio chagasii]CAH7161031.1 hypothetical protein VCHA38P215_20171 [Vibrio chagasii]|tara:strand:- start:254 stop:547 length:294 start_codon:yes stop_codon:yes gene_type:complete